VELPADSGEGAQSQQAASNHFFGSDRLVRAAVQVATDLPESVQKQTQVIRVRSWDGISLEMSGHRTAEWGSCEQGARKAAVLLALIKASAGAVHYDVSAPSSPASVGS
jgi:cell division protein FtsQ